MSKSFTYTATEAKAAAYAIDALTTAEPDAGKVHTGLLVLRRLVADGAIGTDLSAITGKSGSTVGRTQSMIALVALVDDTTGEGVMDANRAVNKANKVKGLNLKKKHIDQWTKKGTRFATWAAVAAAIDAQVKAADPTVGTEDDEQQQSSGKTYDEKIEDLLKKARKIAKDHESSPAAVLADVWALLERTPGEEADEAADAADLAS